MGKLTASAAKDVQSKHDAKDYDLLTNDIKKCKDEV